MLYAILAYHEEGVVEIVDQGGGCGIDGRTAPGR